MKFSDVMAHYDYKMSKVAKAVNQARNTIATWKESDKIPFRMQCVLEVITDGKLKADREDHV